MHVLMLVATPVATDTRVLREARSLVADGHHVHVVGRSVPVDFEPPEGVTVSSVGTSSVFRPEGVASPARRPGTAAAAGAPAHPATTSRRRPPHLRLARWLLLPQHRRSAFGRWAQGVRAEVLGHVAIDDPAADAAPRTFDVVHAHDLTALQVGAALARERGVPLVYDSHELWSGRPREHRPTPLADRRERRVEGGLGREAAAVITVGEGVAQALRERYGWDHVHVVRNTFPEADTLPDPPPSPVELVYAGRLAAYRELETIAEATRAPGLPLPVTLIGPADETWLARFEPGTATVLPPVPPEEVTDRLTAAGLVLVTHSDRWENHRLALPNKLFHAVRAGVPVVATDVGELARTVRAHGLGTLYRPGDAGDLRRAVGEAVDRYAELRDRVRAASAELSWATDEQVLLGIYRRLADHAGPGAVPPRR